MPRRQRAISIELPAILAADGALPSQSDMSQASGAIGRIRRIPSIGSNYGEVLKDVRRYRFRSHTIYYVVLKDGVRIVRILHVRMSPDRHLPE